MFIRCLPGVLIAAALLPARAQADPVTIGVHSIDGGAALLPATLSFVSPRAITELALPTAKAAAAITVGGLAARGEFLMELIVHGPDSSWHALKGDVLGPVGSDGGLGTAAFSASTGGTQGLFGQAAAGNGNGNGPPGLLGNPALERSAAFAGGLPPGLINAASNRPDVLIFAGIIDNLGTITLRFGLTDSEGAANFLARLNLESAQDPIATPEPASMLLLGTGLAGMFAARRRRQAQRDPGDN